MSTYTATASTIEGSNPESTPLLAFELGEASWPLGFSVGTGGPVLRRKIDSGDTTSLLREVARARAHFGLDAQSPAQSCYETGRDGFWLHRFLIAHGISNVVIDSASIEVNRRKKRTKTDRLDVMALVDLLWRHVAGSRKRPFAVVTVPEIQDEDLRHLGRELKLMKEDRTRTRNRMKGLIANNGLVIRGRRALAAQIGSLRLWKIGIMSFPTSMTHLFSRA